MSTEAPLPIDMFTGEPVDNRTARQKRLAKIRAGGQRIGMFPQPDLFQSRLKARPQIPLPPGAKLALIMQDPRTPEQVELDRQRAAEALNGQLFTDPEPEPQLAQPQGPECPWARPSIRNTPYLVDLLTALV